MITSQPCIILFFDQLFVYLGRAEGARARNLDGVIGREEDGGWFSKRSGFELQISK